MKRRALSLALSIAAGVAVAVSVLARYRLPYRPVLEQVQIPVPRGHEGLAGLRIGLITDTHIGPFIGPKDVYRAGSLLALTNPDLMLFGGDFISESPRYARPAAAVLGRLAATAPLGGIAVLGNHDISTGHGTIVNALVHNGIRVLRNEAIQIAAPGGELWIAGIDETILGTADLDAAFARIPPESAVLVLWHEPDYAKLASAKGAFAQLSGHTHGGQVRLPAVGPLVLPPGGRRFPSGLYHVGPMALYTARGVGVYRPPVRLNCPPEVTLVTLTAPVP
ncbi:MAG: metallophosphoesterase [Chloroflexota bacterium]|nr:metallophosphoesterase [Chloroflexota bacterium]